jgi:hypothetical protein
MTLPKQYLTIHRRNPTRVALVGAALMGAALCLAAPAAGAASSHDTCFARSNVESFSAPDDHTVYLRVGVNDIYRLDLMTSCLDLTFRQGIGLEDQPANAFICSPLEATVVYRAAGGIPQRCPVKAIHKLTPAEVAALPKKDRP